MRDEGSSAIDPVQSHWDTVVYLARFYRKGKMVHAQKDVLSAIAKLCRDADAYAAVLLLDGEEHVGNMSTGGIMSWYVEDFLGKESKDA